AAVGRGGATRCSLGGRAGDQDQEDPERHRPRGDEVRARARHRAVRSFSWPPVKLPRPAASPFQQFSLSLWLTELADGLALKELRYALRRFAPAASRPPLGPPFS